MIIIVLINKIYFVNKFLLLSNKFVGKRWASTYICKIMEQMEENKVLIRASQSGHYGHLRMNIILIVGIKV